MSWSLSEIGAAAASHGRHMPDTCETITDWNSATKSGWYMGNNAANGPTTVASGGTIWYFGEVIAHNINYIIQVVYQFTASTDAKSIPKYIRAKMKGTWGAWTNVTVSKAVPSNAVFTDTNTWRGVQDNLTSTATDQSLSANQGKVLKGLIDGKAASSHTHNYAGSSSAGGAANSATKLATARSINGTNFDGTGNITTANWGTARNIKIADSSATNTGSSVSVNGSGDATLKLPATIKATLSGNASTATKATQDSAGQQISATYIKGLSAFGGTITYTKGDGSTGTTSIEDVNLINTITTNGYLNMYFQCNGCGSDHYLLTSTFYVPYYIRQKFSFGQTPLGIYIIDDASDFSTGGTSVATDYKHVKEVGAGNYLMYSNQTGANGNSSLSWKYVRVKVKATSK
ncbi:MAG: pyocin knob domain-containing protein [Catenibacterium mitsuokai]